MSKDEISWAWCEYISCWLIFEEIMKNLILIFRKLLIKKLSLISEKTVMLCTPYCPEFYKLIFERVKRKPWFLTNPWRKFNGYMSLYFCFSWCSSKYWFMSHHDTTFISRSLCEIHHLDSNIWLFLIVVFVTAQSKVRKPRLEPCRQTRSCERARALSLIRFPHLSQTREQSSSSTLLFKSLTVIARSEWKYWSYFHTLQSKSIAAILNTLTNTQEECSKNHWSMGARISGSSPTKV